MAADATEALRVALEQRLPVDETTLLAFGGAYGYSCRMPAGAAFEPEGDVARKGRAFVVPRVARSGIEVKV